MIHELLQRTRGTVVAATRSSCSSSEPPPPPLSAVAQGPHGERLQIVGGLDLTQPNSISAFAADLEQRCGGRIDVLLNTVGILHGRAPPRPGFDP